MKDQNYAPTKTPEVRLVRRSPEQWRVTFDHPPLNIFGPEMLPQVNEIITAIEIDERVKVVVFDSAVEGFFLIHLDFLAKLDDLVHLPGKTDVSFDVQPAYVTFAVRGIIGTEARTFRDSVTHKYTKSHG